MKRVKDNVLFASILSLLAPFFVLMFMSQGIRPPSIMAPLILVNFVIVCYFMSFDTKYDMRKLIKKHIGGGK